VISFQRIYNITQLFLWYETKLFSNLYLAEFLDVSGKPFFSCYITIRMAYFPGCKIYISITILSFYHSKVNQ